MFERIRQYLRSLRSDETEEVCRHLRRPANLSRRSFLRVLGVTSVTVAVGGWDKLLPQPCPFDLRKAAADLINDFTRIKMCEDGFLRRILPPLLINDGIELDRFVPTDRPSPQHLQNVVGKRATSVFEIVTGQPQRLLMGQSGLTERDTGLVQALTPSPEESRARKFLAAIRPTCTCGRHDVC